MRSNRSVVVAKLSAFMYYSKYGFKDFIVGNTDDPSNLNIGNDIFLSTENFKIAKVENREIANEVINYFLNIGCVGSSFHTEADKGYVYVCLKADRKGSG